ncbi:ferrous iron transport protein B [uncultured Bacteroides sp.]|uniref:ferrous iron transport protein B n=1 Tax=uncultured Bacteroides sp. TaxID=162156 RepID=UPI00263932E4|nr:ferrous iron transport protein B [uncultured Bacteroides sp.]
MKLSELKTGEKGVIVKVYGHGGFRKRIIEMGFIKGKMVEVMLNAPLKDPVKYKIMDYEVSLRRAEADMVEVVSENDAKAWSAEHPELKGIEVSHDEMIHRIATEKGKTIHVAFVGNPNCGKTSLFNIASGAHERVGNYSGVTVDAKEGSFEFNGYKFKLTDLPGTYSLSAYTPEELYVRKHIIEKTPDIILNVVDATNLERNLYLTTQLIDMDVPMIMALNMYDELRESGNKLDIDQLSKLLGVQVIPTVAKTGEGIDKLFNSIIDIYEGKQQSWRHIHVNHGKLIEDNISKIEKLIRVNPEPHNNYSGRFLAIKLLENDHQVESIVKPLPNADDIFQMRSQCQENIKKEIGEDSESAITDAKYGFVQGALKECFEENHQYKRLLTKRIDAFVTHKLWGYPIFLLLMYIMFYCTFNLGAYPMDWIDAFIGWLGETVGNNMSDGPLKDLIVDGIIGGVGGVIVFLPNIMILYAFISWMEDSGYMARAAFIMDKIMHKMGLHGKSFIPMIMGFGCNIPAIMATRTIEDRKSRLITMLVVPMMSCSARLPVYIIIIGAFFPHNAALVLFSLYLIGILMSILLAKLFSRYIVKGESSPFVMELPPYRMPSAKSVTRHTWEKGKQYLKKMGTTILVASIIVWALSYYPRFDEEAVSQNNTEQVAESQIEHSYIGRIGHFIEPVIRPCGFEWKEGVSIITGVGAKEIVASTMGVLYSQTETEDVAAETDTEVNPDGAAGEEAEEDEDAENARLSSIIAKSGLTPLAAFSFLIFVLLYMPCIPACISIKNEAGGWRWALFTIGYTTLLAWICSTLVFQIGSLFI